MVNLSLPSDHLLRTQSKPYGALDHLLYKGQGRASNCYICDLILREQFVADVQILWVIR